MGVLKENLQRKKQTTKTTKYTYGETIIYTNKDIHKISTSPLVYTNIGWPCPPTEGMVARPERRWGCRRRSTPQTLDWMLAAGIQHLMHRRQHH